MDKDHKPQKNNILKGNFNLKNEILREEVKEDLTSRFEKEALKRLGGSIAFVSKKKFLFDTNKKNREKA